MEGWKDGRMEGWKGGRMEGWKGGRMEEWKGGRMEGWKVDQDFQDYRILPGLEGMGGRMEGWKDGRMEEWKGGRMEGWKGGRVEGWKDGWVVNLHNLTECATRDTNWKVCATKRNNYWGTIKDECIEKKDVI